MFGGGERMGIEAAEHGVCVVRTADGRVSGGCGKDESGIGREIET